MIRLTNKKILLILGWLCYTIFFFTKKYGIVYPPLIQGYFSDFLAIPLILGIILLVMRIYTGNKLFRLSVVKVLVAFLYISIAFEGILPIYKPHFHADIWDVVAYGLGAGVFLWLQNNDKLNNRKLLQKKSEN